MVEKPNSESRSQNSEERIQVVVAVTLGGGVLIGIEGGLVYFNDRDPRFGSTMVLPLHCLTCEAVRLKIAQKRSEFFLPPDGTGDTA